GPTGGSLCHKHSPIRPPSSHSSLHPDDFDRTRRWECVGCACPLCLCHALLSTSIPRRGVNRGAGGVSGTMSWPSPIPHTRPPHPSGPTNRLGQKRCY